MPRQQQSLNSQTRVLDTVAGRILCIADLRGRLSNVNDLAREANAKAVIHTGDFGFFGTFFLSCEHELSSGNCEDANNGIVGTTHQNVISCTE